MSKDEAIKAMQAGHKMAHRFFSKDEWVKVLPDGRYEFEDGNVRPAYQFWVYRDSPQWETGWYTFDADSQNHDAKTTQPDGEE